MKRDKRERQRLKRAQKRKARSRREAEQARGAARRFDATLAANEIFALLDTGQIARAADAAAQAARAHPRDRGIAALFVEAAQSARDSVRARAALEHRYGLGDVPVQAVLGLAQMYVTSGDAACARPLVLEARARFPRRMKDRKMWLLVAQGVFFEKRDGTLSFAPTPVPTDLEVARLLASARRRIVRLVRRHGIYLEQPGDEVHPADERLFESPMYAEIQGAAVAGRVATGPRAGRPVMRVGRDLYAAQITSTGPLHAHLEGFDLHAAVAVPAGDRERLEHLCRYVLRPPIAQDALELTPDGKVLLRLRRPWSDGTRAICFEPSELLEKLAAMIPKPRINLLVYHGVFAPHARKRPGAVRRAEEGARCHGTSPGADGESGDAETAATANSGALGAGADVGAPAGARPPPAGYTRPKYYAWANLLERTFQIDVLACPGCGGRLRLIATIGYHAVIEKILRHLGLPIDHPEPAPPRHPAWLPGFEVPTDSATEWPS